MLLQSKVLSRRRFSSGDRWIVVMKYLLCIVIFVACEAARIPRVSEQAYFPNYHGIHHGPNHNYHDGQGDGHVGGSGFFAGLENGFYGQQGSIDNGGNFGHRVPGAPLQDVASSHAPFNPGENIPLHNERFNHAFNYDYQ